MKRYTAHEMHRLLLEPSLSARWRETEREPDGWIEEQALHCPYYVPLEGKLGADWGVIVNPESTRFGLLTFEHDECGCPAVEGQDYKHYGDPDQETDAWCSGWVHVCDDYCDSPCERAPKLPGVVG